MAIIHAKSRDNARTPMQSNGHAEAGFTTGTPWLKVNPNYRDINVAQALSDPNSIFAYYQQLIRLRKANPVIVYGTYDLLLEEHEQIYAFTRSLDAERVLVVLNFTRDETVFTLPSDVHMNTSELLIGNYAVDPAHAIHQFTLRPFEARVYRLW